jgi:hypothetical protein
MVSIIAYVAGASFNMNDYYGEERRFITPGRREADRDVCIYHDICHETVSVIKAQQKAQAKEIQTKLPTWIFRLFVSTMIPLAIAVGGWIGYNAFESAKVLSRLETNQIHLMKEFAIKPVKVPDEMKND